MSTNGRRKKILFIGEAVTLSHVVRPAVLANTLDSDRYEVVLAADGGYAELLGDDHSFKFVPLDCAWKNRDMDNIARLREQFLQPEMLTENVREDRALFRRYNPDVVVGDMRLSLAISAKLHGLPVVNIQSCLWHPSSGTALESPVSSFPLPEPLGTALSSALYSIIAPFALWQMSMVSMAHGLPPSSPDFKRVLSFGDYLVFPDIPEWSPLSSTPENAVYVGPITWSPTVEEPAWWQDLDEKPPVIYVSLGSSGQHRLLERIIRVVSRFPVTLIVSTAGRREPKGLPDNVLTAPYVDGRAAAARASLVICNGGHTAAPQALAEGCPVLAVASNADQLAFSRRLVQIGAARLIKEDQIDDLEIHSAVSDLLANESYRRAADTLRQAIARIDTARAFNDFIDKIVGGLQPERVTLDAAV